MSAHTISERPPSDTDYRRLSIHTQPLLIAWGCLVGILGIGAAFWLGAFGNWLGTLIGGDAPWYGKCVGWGLAILLFTAASVTYYRQERVLRNQARKDAASRKVQVIAVTQPRVVQIAYFDDQHPILCFDIGNNKVLLLQGRWLCDPGTYGVDQAGDDDGESLNGLHGRHAFPNTEFTVERWPHSGIVLSIQTAGEPLRPEKTVHGLKDETLFADSQLFEGKLEDMEAILEREQRARQNGGVC